MTKQEIVEAVEMMKKIKSLPRELWTIEKKEGKKQQYPYCDEMVDATGGYGYYSIVVYMSPQCAGIVISCSEPTPS